MNTPQERRRTGSVNLVAQGGYEVSEGDDELVEMPKSHFVWYQQQLARLQSEIEDLRREVRTERMAASYDQLTGILNRRGFDMEMRRELSIAARENRPLVVCVFDLDKFKMINDTYGHVAGDIVLRSFADMMQKQIRAHDILARTGGEEFVVTMPNTGIEDAKIVLARMQTGARMDVVTCGRQQITYTFSAGIALASNGETRDSVVSRADSALYIAKRSGRDQYAVAV